VAKGCLEFGIMDKILFLNACLRPCSRTLELAKVLLQRLQGDIEEVRLCEMPPQALDLNGMEKRHQAAAAKVFSDPLFDAAKQFADADIIVIAAPYWDLMFPAVLKTYLENITVSGITFYYSEQGMPQSLCRARKLYYVTTAGGFIGQNDFGFSYVKALAQSFFGIAEIHCYAAQGLDIFGADVEAIMSRAKTEIISESQEHTIPYPIKGEDRPS
jgi:FMN-dependent NADH-azoreductase